MAIAVILKNNVISMVISICITMNLMSLVYYLIDRLIDKVGIHNFVISKYTVTGWIAMLGMGAGRQGMSGVAGGCSYIRHCGDNA